MTINPITIRHQLVQDRHVKGLDALLAETLRPAMKSPGYQRRPVNGA